MATLLPAVEQRVVLRNVSWETYEALLAGHEESSAPRLTYDRGTLEIMSPLPEHEEINRALASLVEDAAVEWRVSFRNLGSTTFKRQDRGRGFEPDSCLYLRNAERVRGKAQLDLTIDPPPDLVIEINLTHASLDKLPVYAELGAPEVWRWDGGRLAILVLGNGAYQEGEESLALPRVTASALADRLRESREMDAPDWILHVREWARGLRVPPH